MSVIVNKFDVMHVTILPSEAKPKLIVDADAPLPFSVTFERFQPICRRNVEIGQTCCRVELKQLSVCGLRGGAGDAFYKLARPNGLGDFIGK